MGPEQDTFHRGDLCLKAGRHCDVDVASVDRKQVICLAKWRVSDLGTRVRWEIQISSGIRIAQEMCETMRGPGNCGEHVMRRSHLSLKSISTKILLQLSPFFFWTCVFFRSGSKRHVSDTAVIRWYTYTGPFPGYSSWSHWLPTLTSSFLVQGYLEKHCLAWSSSGKWANSKSNSRKN